MMRVKINISAGKFKTKKELTYFFSVLKIIRGGKHLMPSWFSDNKKKRFVKNKQNFKDEDYL